MNILWISNFNFDLFENRLVLIVIQHIFNIKLQTNYFHIFKNYSDKISCKSQIVDLYCPCRTTSTILNMQKKTMSENQNNTKHVKINKSHTTFVMQIYHTIYIYMSLGFKTIKYKQQTRNWNSTIMYSILLV